MGSSLNTHLGLAELDCHDREQYVTQVVTLATDPTVLSMLKERLHARRPHAASSIPAPSRALEEALYTIWE